MARLNEAPLPTENVDARKPRRIKYGETGPDSEAVRRRFIRQNKDLAKVNSSQSLRIRTLECDASRMLAENLNLREEILRLQNQLSAAQNTVDVSSVEIVRSQLQAKIEEIGHLVAGLGLTQSAETEKRIADPSSWKPSIPRALYMSQEARLPAIPEGKQHPRRTLESDEIRALRLSQHSNESPDLGPPPVAHFDSEDPIKFDTQPLPTQEESEQVPDDGEILPATMSINLETRRKRRDGSSRLSSIFTDVAEDPAPTKVLRTGAKRKLSVRETDDAPKAAIKDDFRFSWKVSTATESSESGVETVEIKTVAEVAQERQRILGGTLEPPVAERRVLGEKSVNMSPQKSRVSSRTGNKAKLSPSKDFVPDEKPGIASRTRKPRVSTVVQIPPKDDIVVDTIELPQDEPIAQEAAKTPAPDLFSPTPSETSVVRPEGRDTPPPSGLGARFALDGASDARPARRARAAVSYAEPSLNTKMRRPTKELVDAVYAANKKAESQARAADDKMAIRKVVIKQEHSEDSGWKSLAAASSAASTSPLGAKAGRIPQPTPPSHLKTERKETSASGASNDALISMNSNAKDNAHSAEAGKESDIYEFKSSSPAAPRQTIGKSISRLPSHRRHSSVPHSLLNGVDINNAADSDRSSIASLSPPGDGEHLEPASVKIGPALSRPEARSSGRTERTSTRRRSMML